MFCHRILFALKNIRARLGEEILARKLLFISLHIIPEAGGYTHMLRCRLRTLDPENQRNVSRAQLFESLRCIKTRTFLDDVCGEFARGDPIICGCVYTNNISLPFTFLLFSSPPFWNHPENCLLSLLLLSFSGPRRCFMCCFTYGQELMMMMIVELDSQISFSFILCTSCSVLFWAEYERNNKTIYKPQSI